MPEPKARYTPTDYLELERRSETRHEYLNGEIFAMGGASRRHAHDMRVRVETTGLYTYLDVVAVCEQPRFEDEEVDTLLNPTFLAEVLSKSTEDYDRGGL